MEISNYPQLSQEFILVAQGPGNIGTTSKITGFLADQHCYITDLKQYDDRLSNRFYIRCVFSRQNEVSPSTDLISEYFTKVATEESLVWKIQASNVKMRAVILVSRLGHCLNDLLYRQKTGELKMEVTAVISNHPDLRKLVEWHNIPYHHLPIAGDNKASQENLIKQIIQSTDSKLVILARYMQVLSDDLCNHLEGWAINIHHSFLPGFKGARPYHQAHDRGVKLIGATAHYVTRDLDDGPIIEQVVDRVDHTITADRMVSVGRNLECLALSRAVNAHLERRVFMNGMKTVVFS
ncbi:formyltetrahydrofolate deformylase [biofilm metagenome]